MSGNNNETIRELVSAYLDDALSGSERHQAEQLLRSDESAARYFEQLRVTRECLRSLAPSSMRSSIAERVISRARALATAEGLPAQHHVLRNLQQINDVPQNGELRSVLIPSSQAPSSSEINSDAFASSSGRAWTDWLPRSNRQLWSALVALAAAIFAMFALPNLLYHSPFDPAPLADQMSSQGLPDASVSSDGMASAADRTESGVAPAMAVERSPFDSIAMAGERMPPDNSTGRSLPVRELSETQFEYLMTVDAVMSRAAWESSYFDSLLSRAGVPKGNPIKADEQLTKLLDDSLVTVSSSDAADAPGETNAALLFVQAKGRELDNLLVAMSKDREHFLSVAYNLSIDAERILLRRLLSKQTASEVGEALGARVLLSRQESAADGDLVPNFVAHAPSNIAGALGLDTLPPGGLSALNPSPDLVAGVLVIVREPRTE